MLTPKERKAAKAAAPFVQFAPGDIQYGWKQEGKWVY